MNCLKRVLKSDNGLFLRADLDCVGFKHSRKTQVIRLVQINFYISRTYGSVRYLNKEKKWIHLLYLTHKCLV